MTRLQLTALFASVFFFSCKKEATIPVESKPYIWINPNTVALNVDLYKTQEDYYNNTNKYLSVKIPARGRIMVESNKLDSAYRYTIDIYSDDMNYSNWSEAPSFYRTYYNWDSMEIEKINFSANHRKIFLKGNSTESYWRAYDIVDQIDNVSKWNNLKEAERFFECRIKKDFNAYTYQKDLSNNVVTAKYFCSYSNVTLDILNLDLKRGKEYGGAEYSVQNATKPSFYSSNGLASMDTIIMWRASTYYYMKRVE